MDELTNEQYEEFAYSNFTLPRYVFVLNGKIADFAKVFEGVECVSGQGQFINPLDTYSLINQEASVKLHLEETEILRLFTLVNSNYSKIISSMDRQPAMIGAFLLAQGEIGETLEVLLAKRNEIAAETRAEIDKFREYFAQKLQQKLVFDNAPSFVSEGIVETARKITRSFKKSKTLLDIFNETPVSHDIPLITSRDYFKVLKGFRYSLDAPEDGRTLFFFARGEKIVLSWNESYSDPEFEITHKKETFKEFDALVGIENAVVIKQKQTVSTTLYSPDFGPFDFNKHIWEDLIMNNPYVSSQFVVNEYEKIASQRTIVPMFFFPAGAQQTIEDELKAEKRSFSIKAQSVVDSTKGGKFLTRIEVKLNDWEKNEVGEFVSKLCKVFGLYIAEQKSIAALYNKLLDLKIRISVPKQEEKKRRLKDIEPKLFLPGYVRNQCQFAPEVIEDNEEIQDYEAKGFQVMQFPQTADEGLEQRSYVCAKYDRNIFPGLQVNKLSNKDKYKYIPCCFKDDQKMKGTTYRFYLDPRVALEKGRRAGFIETDKILDQGQKGNPPLKLKKLFALLGSGPVLRIGTKKSPASILECITRSPKVDGVRSDLAGRNLELIVSAQEIATIGGLRAAREILGSSKAYLDPRIFYRFLEYCFGCRLVLLGKEDFIFPNYMYDFAHFHSEKPIIVAYENEGSSIQNADFPQWEYFQGIDPILEELYALYAKDFKRHGVSRDGSVFLIQEPFRVDSDQARKGIVVHSQFFNSYRQTIALNVGRHGEKEQTTYLLRYPIPPLPIPISTDSHIRAEKQRGERIEHIPVPYADHVFMISGAVPLQSAESSWLVDFVNMKKTSNLIVEQAIHSASNSVPLRVGKLSALPHDKWARRLVIPARIKPKVDYSVKLFKKNYPEEFAEYKNYKVIPNRFSSMIDFERRADEVVSRTDVRVEWDTFTPVLERKPLVGKQFNIEIDEKIYLCSPIETSEIQQARDINICVFNTREIFSVGKPRPGAGISIIFFLTSVGKYHSFSCRMATAQE
jgi:hypothetical protein